MYDSEIVVNVVSGREQEGEKSSSEGICGKSRTTSFSCVCVYSFGFGSGEKEE